MSLHVREGIGMKYPTSDKSERCWVLEIDCFTYTSPWSQLANNFQGSTRILIIYLPEIGPIQALFAVGLVSLAACATTE
ncbi:hypothetical protein ACS0TY_019382 [Phlomoides rotata]